MRAAPVHFRFAWAMLFALLLALRSLAPAGFMPAFDHGAITIVACPGAADMGSMAMNRDGDHQGVHQQCPYAAVSALGALGPDWAPPLAVPLFAVALLLGRTFLFLERQGRERPRSRGPPIPA
jgi:hypothetical protein